MFGTRGLVVVAAVCCALALPWRALGQADQAPRQRVYVEAAGSGLVYSLNYERAVTGGFGLRAGAAGLAVTGVEYGVVFAGPTWQAGTTRHAIHLGAGPALLRLEDVWVLESADEWVTYGFASAAYQFQPGDRGVFLRVAFTPIFTAQEWNPWFGVALGWAF